MSRLRPLLLAVLALASFLATGAAWRSIVPWPDEYGLRAKWEWLAEHADEIDVLFVGSSVTAYGLVPPVFDQAMAERGYELRSFNLGVGGMMPIEADHVLREVLALESARLRYVFVEAGPWEGTLYVRDQKNLFSPRMVHWHDWRGTLDALVCLSNDPPPPEGQEDTRWADARRHLLIFLRKLTSAGQGLRTVRALLGLDEGALSPTPEELEELRGYVDLDVIEDEEWDRRRERFLQELERYRRDVAQVGPNNRREVPVDRHRNRAGLERQIASVRAAGAEPLYYLGPRVASDPLAYALAAAGVLPTFFGLNRPGEYPELYAIENHFDTNHLNRAGAELFTRTLARVFADHLDAERKE